MANITGDNNDETLAGTSGDDTIVGGGGNDTITGADGNDFLIGDGLTLSSPPPAPPPLPGPTIMLDSGEDVDFTDLAGVATTEPGQATFQGQLGENYGTIEITGIGGGGSDDADTLRFDLTTFDDNFTIEITDKKQSDEFDEFQFVGADSITQNGSSEDWTITYTNDGQTYTVNLLNTGGASVTDGFGGPGSGGGGGGGGGGTPPTVTTGEVIEQMDVTVGTLGVSGSNAANYGNGSVDKVEVGGTTSSDAITSVENFVANEFVEGATPASGTIDIDNASFENPSLSNGDFTYGSVAGWNLSGNGGIYDENNEVGNVTGDNVAYLEGSGGSISQTLSKTYDADETYTFTADIGDPDYSGSQGYTVNLYAGATLIGSTSGNTGDADTLQEVTVTSNVSNAGLNGQALRFEVVNTSGSDEMHVDNVQGSFVNSNPSPGGEKIDSITLTGAVEATDVVGIGDDAIGFVTYNSGASDETTVNFGDTGQPTINELLNGTVPEARPNARSEWTITENDADESGEVGGITYSNFEQVNFEVVCFVRGSRIETAAGPKRIEEIEVGDMIRTMDHGLQPVRWIRSTTVRGEGNNAPILFRKGALGTERDLLVSPQHRMLLSGWQLEMMFAEHEALVPAKMLINDRTVIRVEMAEVEYFHMMFDEHEIVFAEGAPSESFHPGRMGVGSFSEETREEIFQLFPELQADLKSYGHSARMTLKSYEAAILVDGSDMLDIR